MYRVQILFAKILCDVLTRQGSKEKVYTASVHCVVFTQAIWTWIQELNIFLFHGQ